MKPLKTLSLFNFNSVKGDRKLVRIRFLRLFYFICGVIIPIFVVKQNLQYAQQNLNWVYGVLYLLFLLSPLVELFRQNDFEMSSAMIITSTAILSMLLYEAGGMDAPGLVWLAAVPVTYAILVGRQGAIIGGVLVLADILIFQYLESHHGLTRKIAFDETSFRFERLFNMIAFAGYTVLTTMYYIQNEEKSFAALSASQHDVESLLRTVLHDIANPVTVANFGLQGLLKQKDASDEAKQKSLRRVAVGLENISSVLDKVLALKAMLDGKAIFKKESVDVNQSIVAVLELLETNASNKKVKFDFVKTSNEPKILIDPTVFKNIIICNFLTNAIKFSNENGTIKISTAVVHGEQVMIHIIDQGIGIPKHIFERIWQVDAQTSRPGTNGEKGTGYGMPLAKEFTEKMGGNIRLLTSTEEVPNGPIGTQVYLTFPIDKTV